MILNYVWEYNFSEVATILVPKVCSTSQYAQEF